MTSANPASAPHIQLTDEFKDALEMLDRGTNVLITGKAGTGKSTLLRLFLDQADAGEILVTAPTGVAALNVGGFTIHRAFGFRPGWYPDDLEPGGKWQASGPTAEVLTKAKVLVIDEISMVRADLFDMMDIALRRTRGVNRPFGGIQLVLVGDLLQLPPVVTDSERELFRTRWETPYFFSSHVYNRLDLREITLTTVWRQSNEQFIEVLNEIREGSVGEGARELLNGLVEPEFTPPNDWVTLASFNRRVAKINSEHLSQLPGEKFVSRARYEGVADKNSFNGADELHYAVGARVMTVINDPGGRFVNGSFGEIVEATPEVITVRIDVTGALVNLREHSWTVNQPKVTGGKLSGEKVGMVWQFPVILAWAITIHKSQGKTIPKLYIDLTGGTSTDGQFYVAISRAVDLENLRFSKPVEAHHIRASNTLVRRIRRATTSVNSVSRLTAISVDGVDFGLSEHVARVHAVIVENGRVVADFGSWINPAADLGDFGRSNKIPPGGLACAPTLGDFWPLLLRQAAGSAVVGDGLMVLERAVRHQEKGHNLSLGLGHDVSEINLTLTGADPADRAREIANAFISGNLNVKQGQPVPEASVTTEGAVFIPSWAPQSPMVLDPSRATESDIAWASLSGGRIAPQDTAEVQECIELIGAWATSRGMWTAEMRDDIVRRAKRSLPFAYDAPPLVDAAPTPDSVLFTGTRVAFTGRNNLLGGPADDDRLTAICQSHGLEYKKAVSRTRCDVLVAGDVASMSRKAQAAREFGKPIISQEDFERWYYENPHGASAAPEPVNRSATPLVGKPASKPVAKPVTPTTHRMNGKKNFPETHARLVSADEALSQGTRVAFRGSTYIFGQLYPHGPALEQLCADLGLEYKQAVTKTRCDVLVSDDYLATDGKSGLARRYGKLVVTAEEFRRWAESRISDVSQEADPKVVEAEVVDETEVPESKPITAIGTVPVEVDDDTDLPEDATAGTEPGQFEAGTARAVSLETPEPDDRRSNPVFKYPSDRPKYDRPFDRIPPEPPAVPSHLRQPTPAHLLANQATPAPPTKQSRTFRRWAKNAAITFAALTVLVFVMAAADTSDAVAMPVVLAWAISGPVALVLGVGALIEKIGSKK